MSTNKVKLKDKFEVSKFMTLIDLDFIYSEQSNQFLLLNQDMWGKIDPAIINKQKGKNRIIVINNDTMILEYFNIPEEEINNALIQM